MAWQAPAQEVRTHTPRSCIPPLHLRTQEPCTFRHLARDAVVGPPEQTGGWTDSRSRRQGEDAPSHPLLLPFRQPGSGLRGRTS